MPGRAGSVPFIATETPDATEHEAAAVVGRAFAALAAKDLEAVAAFWHDDVVEEFIPVGTFRGKEEVRGYFEGLFAAVPDFTFTPGPIASDGATVFAAWHATGTFDGAPFQGIEPTGRPVDIRGVDRIELEDGLIRTNTVYYDGMTFAQQIGMLPPRDSAAEKAVFGAFNALTKARRAVRGRPAGHSR